MPSESAEEAKLQEERTGASCTRVGDLALGEAVAQVHLGGLKLSRLGKLEEAGSFRRRSQEGSGGKMAGEAPFFPPWSYPGKGDVRFCGKRWQ